MSTIVEKARRILYTMPPQAMRALLMAGLVGFNALVLLLSAILLYHSQQQYQHYAETQTQNIANALDENVSASIEKINITLHAVADEIERQLAEHKEVDEQAMTLFLERQAQRLPEIEGLRASNAIGLITMGKGVNQQALASLADRDYFIYLRDHPGRALQITKPLIGRVSRKHAILFTQRYSHPDGTFAGVVVATVLVEHFKQLFSQFNLGAHGEITLRDADLGLITRLPATEESSVGQSTVSTQLHGLVDSGIRSATYHALVALDGIERVVTFHRLEKAPMMVFVGIAKEDYLANWYTEAYQTAATVMVFLLFSLLLGGHRSRKPSRDNNGSHCLCARQRCRFRHAIRKQAVWRVPALAWRG